MCDISKLWKEWKNNWPNLVLQFLLFIIIAFFVTEALKPQTDISIECEIREGLNANYTLRVSFYNNADFSGENFHIYLWEVVSNQWGSDYSVSEHCENIRKLEVDREDRFNILCDFIPPQSEFGFSVESDLNREIINTNSIKAEWWGKTTPYKKEIVHCK